HDLSFTQLADNLFRLVLPCHSIPPSVQILKQNLDHPEGGSSGMLYKNGTETNGGLALLDS
ncbi:hypothetical protein, partial [Novosphingobium marinum]|uniref:hypothetical protein n=1 Tax=Novosphingobium marinum TaxID=1514948 RepID=UPI001E422A74